MAESAESVNEVVLPLSRARLLKGAQSSLNCEFRVDFFGDNIHFVKEKFDEFFIAKIMDEFFVL